MSLIEFAKVIFGLVIGLLVTGLIFAMGHIFIEKILIEGELYMVILLLSVLFWVAVSYGVIAWVM